MKTLMAGAVALLSLAPVPPAMAQTPAADFYRGKTVRVLIGFSPGGSSSIYAEILARYMSRHIPGNPAVVGQHMPGAGGLVVANYIAARSPRDGTEFAITSRTSAFEPLLGNKQAQFDPLRLSWVGNANIENSICIAWSDAPVRKMEDLISHELVAGGTGSESLDVSIPRVLNKIAGTKFRLVTGYPGSSEILLALERGEVKAFCGIGWTFLKLRKADWLREKKISLLSQMALGKHPDIPDVPLVQEIARTPEDRQLLDLMMAPQDMGRPFFAPPDVPADRLATLREAFAKTLKDPDFLRDAEKAGVEVQYTSGEAVTRVLRNAYAAPPDLARRLTTLLQD